MVIIKLQGGLGNQLFQYALGRSLMEIGNEVVFDKSFFSNNIKYTNRPFSLEMFKLNPEIKIENSPQSLGILKKIFYRLDNDRRVRYVKSFLTNPNNYMEGYYNSELYFRDIREQLLGELVLKERSAAYIEMEKLIAETPNSLVIHARRTDYLTSTGFTILDENYYKKALELFPPETKIFAFSDDPEWLRAALDRPVYVVSGKGFTDYEELSLMSQGKNFIIANSTFSWWGAWLSSYENKKVVAPLHWFTSKLWWRANRDVVPEGWIRV
jgi:hypothetical protein